MVAVPLGVASIQWVSAAEPWVLVTWAVPHRPLVDVVRVCACGLFAPCCVVLLGSWNGTIAPFQRVQRVRGQKCCPQVPLFSVYNHKYGSQPRRGRALDSAQKGYFNILLMATTVAGAWGQISLDTRVDRGLVEVWLTWSE